MPKECQTYASGNAKRIPNAYQTHTCGITIGSTFGCCLVQRLVQPLIVCNPFANANKNANDKRLFLFLLPQRNNNRKDVQHNNSKSCKNRNVQGDGVKHGYSSFALVLDLR